MSYIKVDPTDLVTAARQMELALGVIEQTTSRNDSLAEMASASGRPDVASAIQSFISAWSYGLSYMKQDVSRIQGLLHTAGDAYLKAEGAIEKAAST
jgi:hypothetical protein